MAKVLIAEDDNISLKLAAKFVADLGHEVYLSPHGKHAYEALKAGNGFDLLLTDIMMPEMDGMQLIQTLRGDSKFVDLPIIIMSAVVGVKEISSLLSLGATLFLPKPLDKKELGEYMERALR